MNDTFDFLVIAEDGTTQEIHQQLSDGETPDDAVRSAINGWLSRITVLDRSLAVWCDEDGTLRGRRINQVGSRLMFLLSGRRDIYVGPIVVTGSTEADIVSLDRGRIEWLLSALDMCRD